MRIQHNIMAMNAYRNYSNNTSALAKNLEKLSSGYRINRAGDDAAGLAISEKMRAQITALGTAQKNVKDGISLVKTAEGATQEVHDMLNRMVDLATQSANGTYQDKVDREAIEQEFNALKTEIDRIADASNFNGIKLLDGSLDGTQPMGTANDVAVTPTHDGLQSDVKTSRGEYTFDLNELKLAAASGDTFSLSFAGVTLVDDITLTAGDIDSNGNVKLDSLAAAINATASLAITSYTMTFEADAKTGVVTVKGKADPTADNATDIASTSLVVNYSTNGNNGGDLAVHIKDKVAFGAADKLARGNFTLTTEMLKDGNQITIGTDTYTIKTSADNKVSGPNVIDLSKTAEGDWVKEAAKQFSQMSNSKFDITADGVDGTVYLREKEGQVDYKKDWDLYGTDDTNETDAEWKNTETGESVVRWAAPDAKGASGKALTLQIGEDSEKYNQLSVNIKDLHVAALGLDKHTLSTQEGAQAAVAAIKDAINTVSTVRSDLGATQNRLEHTQNNLSTMKENIQDAESTIRDTDVAEEMMAYTKNNILVQSAQAMLAQANQIPQGVLQLLG